MAKMIDSNPGDTLLHLRGDEFNALLSLLSELRDGGHLYGLCQREGLELTAAQCERIARLWPQMIQGTDD